MTKDTFNFEEDFFIEDFFITLKDGVKLFARAFFPSIKKEIDGHKTNIKLPTILEYLPYRLSDWTSPRDYERHPYYAKYGYASIRVDLRGHGNSYGIPGDEYDSLELNDGIEVIEWIISQPWSNGKVGMIGISWGGFNALQIAFLQPKGLEAIVTVCSTDDRFDNDVHYSGGSLLAIDMLAWGGTMVAFMSRSPDIKYVGNEYKKMWLERLNNSNIILESWLTHQHRDEYWKHGSICEDYSRINIPIFAVGGWFDPYRDTLIRLVENIKNIKGIIGPWEHQYPDRGIGVGPFIPFLHESVAFFNLHLKGLDNEFNSMPTFRAYINENLHPNTRIVDGTFIRDGLSQQYQEFNKPDNIINKGVKLNNKTNEILVRSDNDTGMYSGRYFPFGNKDDLPPNQNIDDNKSICFEYKIQDEFSFLGNAKIKLRMKSITQDAQIFVRLCKLDNMESTFLTRGSLNLRRRGGFNKDIPCDPNEFMEVEFKLVSFSYKFKKGDILRLSISSHYFPFLLPLAHNEGFILDLSSVTLSLPLVNKNAKEYEPKDLYKYKTAKKEQLNIEAKNSDEIINEREYIYEGTKSILRVDPNYAGNKIYPDGLMFYENALEEYEINNNDNLSFRGTSTWKTGIQRDGFKAFVNTKTILTCDEFNLHLNVKIECFDNDELIFTKKYQKKILREGI